MKKGFGKAINLLLFFAMIVGIILFMVSAYSLVKSKIPECDWKNDYEIDKKLDKKILSNETAIKAIRTYAGVEGTYQAKNMTYYLWKITVKNDNRTIKKYGIDRTGNIYTYEKVCEESGKSLLDKIMSSFKNIKNVTKEPGNITN